MSAVPCSNRAPTVVDGQRIRFPRGTAILDSVVWAVSIVVATRLAPGEGACGGGGLVAGAVIGLAVGLHTVIDALFASNRPRSATIDEVPRLLSIDLSIAAIITVVSLVLADRLISVEAAVVASALALLTHLAARWCFARAVEPPHRSEARRTRRTIILGAGYGAAQAIRSMLEDGSGFQPVAVLDNDPATHHRSIRDVRVLGPWSALGRVARDTGADLLLLTTAPADPESIDRVARQADALGLEVRVMPSPAEVMAKAPPRRPGASAIRGTRLFRPLEIADLLGRRVIGTDVEAIAAYLTGERVLVTGAGGSIGSQLCHEIARYEPERLVMVDRDESALHHVQLSLDGEPIMDSPDLVLGDLRTPGFIDALFEETRPTIVFHAAALNSLPLTERFPDEAFLTNVVATRDLLLAASAYDVRRFVNISTDKAADPQGALGCSKRVAERLTSTFGLRLDEDHRFVSVRLGNVLESHGSVLQTFASQLERGLPMTITDPRMRSFFMSADHACRLILQAGALARSGEVAVLDMGEPHNLEEVARRFANLLGHPNARVVYTRIGSGERVTERLFGAGEVDERPRHPLIAQTAVPPVPMSTLGVIDELQENARADLHSAAVRRWMESAAADGTTMRPVRPPRSMPSAA